VTTPFETIVEVIKRHLPELQKPGTLSVRPGFEFANGWITGKAAVVVTVAKKKAPADMAAGDLLPSVLEGFPVDVHEATTLQATRLTNPKQFLEEAAKLVPERRPAAPSAELAMDGTPIDVPVHGLLPHTTQPHIDYTPAPHVRLVPITDTFTVECVASPDQGWPRLKSFLDATRRSLTVGLYDFTSAHVAATVETAVAGKKLELVLGHPPANPTADQSDEQTAHDLAARVGAGLSFAWSLDNHDTLSDAWIYPSAYHIKVAVRDSASVWLSSGNWNNSNQPEDAPLNDPDPAHAAETFKKSDRDWHVIIASPQLAQLYRPICSTTRNRHCRPRAGQWLRPIWRRLPSRLSILPRPIRRRRLRVRQRAILRRCRSPSR
jgi:hypothetical protein